MWCRVETATVNDVERLILALKAPVNPPALQMSTQKQIPHKQKRSRHQKHKGKNMSKAVHMESSLQLVINKNTLARNGQNYCTCLPDSVSALLPTETRQLVHSSMVASVPVKGDTLVLNITKVVLAHDLSLESVNKTRHRMTAHHLTYSKNATTNWC